MATNNFLPFCPTDTGTNLETQVAYAADTSRTNGNQPGVASSKLINKALRQSAWISSQLAQYMVNVTGQDVLDDQNSTNILATMAATFTSGFNVVSKTSAYNAVLKDYIKASSASFSITLPDATTAGSKGLQIAIEHLGTFGQVYTLLTTGGQTINGVAGGSYALYTPSEVAIVVSDGTNWQVSGRVTSTPETDAGALSITSSSHITFTISSATVVAGDTYTNSGQTFTVTTSGTVTSMPAYATGSPAASGTLTRATGTGPATLTYSAFVAAAPVKGASTYEHFYWYRTGIYCNFRYNYKLGAGTAGTGDTAWFYPANLLPVTTNFQSNFGAIGSTIQSAIMDCLGSGPLASSANANVSLVYSGPSFFKVFIPGNGALGGAIAGNLGNAQTLSVTGRFPVIGWQP